MSIRDKIYNYFDSTANLRVLFVFDAMGMLRNEIEAIDEPWKDGYVYKAFEGDWFSTKVRLATEWQDKRVILVFNQQEPVEPESCLNFPLMSVLKANMVFHEEDAVAFMQQRGISMEYTDFFKRHITELLRDKFNKVLSPYYNTKTFSFDVAHRGILSVYLGSDKLLEWYQLLARIIILFGAEDTTKATAFWGKFTTKSKVSASDILTALKDKVAMLVGFTFDEKALNPMKAVAEAMKYNLITQQLAVMEADPYKKMKVQNGLHLQELNTIMSSIADNTKLSESFVPAFARLSEDVKEETLLDVYGADASYSFLSDAMSKKLLLQWTKDLLYNNPAGLSDKLIEQFENKNLGKKLATLVNFVKLVCAFYQVWKGIDTFKLNTPNLYVSEYVETYSKLDMFYRQAVCAYVNLDMNSESDLGERIKMKLDEDYLSLVNEENVEWLACLKEMGNGFETVTMVERQPEFFKNHLANIKSKTAVIVCDALRYEMAIELLQRLGNKKHIATLTPVLAMLPTETKYTKPSLLPHETLTLGEKKMMVDEKVLASTESRTTHLRNYNDDGLCINYKRLKKLSKTEQREIFKHKLVYVFYNILDDNLHGCSSNTFRTTCEQCFKDLEQLVGFIHDTANVTEIYITSDHGFLYNDKVFLDKDKEKVNDDYVELTTRYYLTENDHDVKGITKFSLPAVSAMSGNVLVAVPNGINRLYMNGGDYQFAHGGASLQELVIPLVYSHYKRVNAKAKVSVSLLEPTLKMASSRLKAHLVQGEAVTMDVQELKVVCAIYVGGEAVTPVKTVVLNSADEEMGASRIFEVDLVLNKPVSSKILQFKVFKDDDRLNPLIEKNIVNNTLIEQDDC